MFDDLDDPSGFTPTDEFRQHVAERGGALRRRRHLRFLSGGLATLLIGMGLAAGTLQWRVSQIDRVDIQTGPTASDGRSSSEVDYIVLVGRDELGRADTIAVARADRSTNTLSVISFPRDLVSEGETRKLSDISLDGPAALVNAVWPGADHYVELDFDGFRSIVDAVGGVAFEVSTPIRDVNSGLALDPGCHTLDGDTALAFVRSRQLEWLGGADTGGDLARIERTQLLLASLAAAGRSTGLSPARLDDLLSIFGEHATIDSNWSTVEMTELAWWLSRLDSDATSFDTLPGVPVTLPDGRAALQRDSSADQLEQTFENGNTLEPAETRPPLISVPLEGRCT